MLVVKDPDRKFEELLLLLASRSADDRAFGVTKLNKLLFFCDFLAYRAWQQPISGQRYQKLEYGPAPLAVVPVLRRLQETEACAIVPRVYFGREQKVVIALREPDLSVFSAQELQLIEDVIADFRHSNGREVSDLTHDFVGWDAAAMKEEIPYETVFVEAPRAFNAAELSALAAAAQE